MIQKKKVLLIRLDKIGDLICTLPADQILDANLFEVTWVIQKSLGQLLDHSEKKYKYLEIDKENPKRSRQIFSQFLKKFNFDTVVSFQCPWWINFELFKAGIPRRIGVLSQWHSFLFLNEGLRQKRSQAIKHEFQYNLELVEKITGPSSRAASDFVFRFQKPSSSKILEKFGLVNYIVVHPGMMGSALNWPQAKYIEHIHFLLAQNKNVVITGTKSDDPYLTEIKKVFGPESVSEKKDGSQYNEPPKGQIFWLQNQLNFSQLLEILNYAEYVIAPSTGVAHIAASLGKDIKAIYSPIRVHNPTRWAPRAIRADQHIEVFFPNVSCPADKHCLGTVCPHYNCMDKVDLA